MQYRDSRSRVRVDARNPRAFGTCDCCGFQYQLSELRYQYDYAGAELINKRLRHCPSCLDLPNWRANPYAIPPDPVPVPDPRIEPFAIEEAGGGVIFLENGAYMQWENGPVLLEEPGLNQTRP